MRNLPDRLSSYLTRPSYLCLLWLGVCSASAQDKPKEAPTVFTTNCAFCHLLDKDQVGPSLVEIAKIYKGDEAGFIQWCVDPGKKRPNMPQMPAMAHVSKDDLKITYDYIMGVTKGVKKSAVKATDAYAKGVTMSARPRIIRTFIPDSGPASLYIALPTSAKHNIVWDTGLCRLRYITIGEPNAWSYYRSNGNDLARMGEKVYTEEEVFTDATAPDFKGYHVKDGLPTFIYKIGDREIMESITLKDGVVYRIISSKGSLPKYRLPQETSKSLKTTSRVSQQTITIIHTPQ